MKIVNVNVNAVRRSEMIKLKKLLKESYVWERKFGDSLPTLKQIDEKYRQRLSEGNGILIVTGNDPITGKYASSYSGKSSVKRKDEKNYASYMGIEGKPELVANAVELIKKYATYIKGERENLIKYFE